MGYGLETYEARVAVSLDEHGGQRERDHQTLWDEMTEKLRAAFTAVAEDPRYAELRPLVTA